jgi:DNA-binding response OmpR family regulator
MAALCLVLSDDLLDSTRIAGHAKAAGFDVVTCRESAALLAALDRKPALALIDLHNPRLAVEAIVPALRAAGGRVIGFGSHVDAARLKAARAAGCDEVLPRSAFFEGLDGRLKRLSGRESP